MTEAQPPADHLRKFSILVVDDELQSLKYFERSFSHEFDVHTAAGVDAALAIVRDPSNRVGVVVTDQRMPEKTGVNLLNELRADHPRIVRILTTAYTDLEDAIEAVNSGAIYKYIVKPWNLRELRGTMLRAVELATLTAERDQLLREKIGVLHRMMVADRIRAFTYLAAGLGSRIRNSMSALKEFVDQAPLQAQRLDPEVLQRQPEFWGDIWQLARDETEQILKLTERVGETVAEPTYHFSDSVVLGQLIEDALAREPALGTTVEQVITEVPDDLPVIRADERLVPRMVRMLAEACADICGPHARIRVAVEEGQEEDDRRQLRLRIAGEGPAWSEGTIAEMFNPYPGYRNDGTADRQLDVLASFFIAHHHGGSLQVNAGPPHGPGFTVKLPIDGTSDSSERAKGELLDRLLLRYEELEV